MENLPKYKDSFFGSITAPSPLAKFGDVESGGLGNFLNVIFKVVIVGAGIYALINLFIAGYSFISAADDPKKLISAWGMVWKTLLGLAIVAGAFVVAALFGQLVFGDPTFIINPRIPIP